ncbi:serine/threonine protein kinase [bacterium]|nr:serine/threonine protein kinase [bacterium]
MTGQTIGGFEIIREIGRGGMGVVYEARQASPRRQVALKVLPPELAHVPQVTARFADEANRMAMLEGHPNIVTVYAAGEDRGVPYFAMQLLPGADLEQHLRREGRLCLDQAAEIVAQVAQALDFAHQRGVVHRDIKPANIMFDSQGRPLVTDFGIAKAREDYRLTQTGMTIGTPEYASPEQIKGDPLDGRSDLYSLAVVLYRAVCGQLPFAATTPMAYAVKHVSEQPLPPSSVVGDIPQALEQVIMRCLAKEPHERFSNGHELAMALRSLRLPHVKCGAAPLPGTTYVTPRPLPPQPVVPVPSRMSGAVIALVVIGALVLLAGIAIIATSQSSSPSADLQRDTGTAAMQPSMPPPPSAVASPSPDNAPRPPSPDVEASAGDHAPVSHPPPSFPVNAATPSHEQTSSSAPESPGDVVRSYFAAMNEMRYRDAYNHFSESRKTELPYEEFREQYCDADIQISDLQCADEQTINNRNFEVPVTFVEVKRRGEASVRKRGIVLVTQERWDSGFSIRNLDIASD